MKQATPRTHHLLLCKAASESGEVITAPNVEGLEVKVFDIIRPRPLLDNETECLINELLPTIDYIIFTSVKSVYYFVERIHPVNGISFPSVLAVGEKTKAHCLKKKFSVSFSPDEFSTDSLIHTIEQNGIARKTFLFPCSALTDKRLKTAVESSGGIVYQVPVYTVEPVPVEEIPAELVMTKEIPPEIILFTSPSSYRTFLMLFSVSKAETYFLNTIIGAIGPSTALEIRKSSVNPSFTASPHTIEALLAQGIACYSENLENKYCGTE